MKRNKLKEPDEWKYLTGKTHLKHMHAFTACKSMSVLMWKLLDEYREEMKDNCDEAATFKDVRLSELLTHAYLMDKIHNMAMRETLEYALNTVDENSVVIYLTHHYSNGVVNAFTGDKLYLVD